jgi:hypothetical protein
MSGDANKQAYKDACQCNHKFQSGNSGHIWSYDIYAVTFKDTYMESSLNEVNTTPAKKLQCFKYGNIGMQQQLYGLIHI